MKSIQEIYSDYNIMPNLQLHQMRVAAVAKTICDHLNISVDAENVVLACLFHDMGNIIKSDFKVFPQFLEPQGLEYWQNVKDDFIKKYGSNEHEATLAIAEEVKLPAQALDLLKKIGFSNAVWNNEHGSFENKICIYSDMRVGPHGVLSMMDRIAEGRKRYEGRKHAIANDGFEEKVEALKNIEKDIFSHTDIKPDDINDESIKEKAEDLMVLRLE